MTAARVVAGPDHRREAQARAARVREREAAEARRRRWADRGKDGPSWWEAEQDQHGEDEYGCE